MIRDERGITVVELLVGLAIAGLIIGTLVTVIFQIFHTTGWGNAELVVQHDLQNAATWLNRDVLTASRADVSGSQMVLEVPDYSVATGDFFTSTITYIYSEVDGTLTRDSVTIARYVDSEPFQYGHYEAPYDVVTVILHSSKGDVRGSGTFALKMRPGGSISVEGLCQITGENLIINPSSKTVQWGITNNGDDSAIIAQIDITWPITNGALSLIKLDTSPIWGAGLGMSSPATITKPLWAGGPENRTIGSGTQKTLEFNFESNAIQHEDLYSIKVFFDNGCTVP